MLNYIKTALLLGLLTGILLSIGFLWSGIFGMTIFLFLAFIMNFISFWYSDKIVLSIYRARELKKSEYPKIHSIVENLCKKAKIPKPKIYLIKLPILNAFATGPSPKKSAIAITKKLLESLEEDEIEGVIAHEISHIKNRDTLTSTIAAIIAGAISYLAYLAWWSLFLGRRGNTILLLPLIFLAPLAATLIQLAISRGREYEADRSGAILTKKPLSLASALQKISSFASSFPLEGNAATSSLFIINPFKKDWLSNLFSTHPPTEERINRLKELAKKI